MTRVLSWPPLVRLRTWLRGHRTLHRVAVRLLNALHRSSDHEAAYVRALRSTVHPGDCVWDVGANVGYHTDEFLRLVGPTGSVIAFDPEPTCVERLQMLGASPRPMVVPAALTDFDGETQFSVAAGEASFYNHIGSGDAELTVRAVRGDTLARTGIPIPSVVKVDVEGWEGEVLDGLGDLVDHVRAFCIEIHFKLLTERGKPNEPTRICTFLQDHGYRITWTDRSHFVAVRG